MKTNKKIIALLVGLMSIPAFARSEGLLNYKPPKTGAPIIHTGGGTRNLGLKTPQIQVLAPPHTALTGQAQPKLYWYLSETKPQTIEITLIEEGIPQPLLTKQLTSNAKTGLQYLSLSDAGVSLTAGKDYYWSVAVVNNGQGANDNIASATFRYQVPPAPLPTIEQQAAAGYWYDVLQKLIDSRSPLTNDILKQIGINIPAL